MAGSAPYVFVSHASADNARLRPVMLALLDAGIPLWFDKPNHPDIRIEDDRFAGYINGGKVWSGAIDDHALPESSAFLIFPSAAAMESKPCWHEVASAMSRWRTTAQRYFIAPLFLEDAALKQMHDEIDSYQGFSTYTVQNGALWELTPNGRVEIDRLIAELRKAFADFHVNPLAANDPRAGVRLRNEDAYLVDRREQIKSSVLAISGTSDAPARHPLLIAYGREDEEPRCFGAVTLPKRVLVRAEVAKTAAATNRPLKLDWPTSAMKNAKDFATLLTSEAATQLQGYDRSRRGSGGPSTPTTLAETLSREGIARVSLTEFPPAGDKPVRSLGDFIAGMRAWCAYWNVFPFETARADGRATFLPVLEVTFARAAEEEELKQAIAKAKGRERSALQKRLNLHRNRIKIERQIRNWLGNEKNMKNLSRPFARVQAIALRELSSVTPADAEHWVDNDDEMFGMLDQHARTQLRLSLRGVFQSAAELPMRTWSERALPVLNPNN